MTTVDLEHANLPQLVQALTSGQETEVVISDHAGRPLVRLVSAVDPRLFSTVALTHMVGADQLFRREPTGVRRLGTAAGKYQVPADIDQDNAEIQRLFEGGQ